MTAPITCSGCGAEMFFALSEKGRRMPLNAKPVGGTFTVDANGTASATKVYTSHFATCPAAAQFRKPKAEPAVPDPAA